MDNFTLYNDLKKLELNRDCDKYIKIICNQAMEIQKNKIFINELKKNNIIIKKYKSYNNFELL